MLSVHVCESVDKNKEFQKIFYSAKIYVYVCMNDRWYILYELI